MNETQWIFLAIGAFGVGYAIAYFFKNIGELWRRWGFFSLFLFPVIVVLLIFGAAAIADLKDTVISLIFALGFVVRMFIQDV